MKAVHLVSVWLKKIKVKTRIRWIFYALMALFALNALGLFQTLLGLGSSGITFTFELSSALVFGLFLYLSFESSKHAARLEERVTVGLEANIQSLKKKIEEKSSAIGGRVGGLEEMVTNIEGGVSNIEGKLSKIDEKASETAGRIGGLEGMAQKIGKMQARVANIEKGLVRIERSVSRIAKTQGRLSKIERGVTNIEGRVSKIAKMTGRSSTEIRRRRARIPGRREIQEVSSGDISRAEGGAQEATSQ